MKNKQKRRAAFEEPSYWQSFSDMMSALMLIFILIIAITLAIYRQKTTDLEQTQVELNSAQQDLDKTREDLERSKQEIEASNQELANSLAELQAAYDKAAMTQEELDAAYQQIADAQATLQQSQLALQYSQLELQNAQQELADTKSELQDIVGIRTDIIGELQNRFLNSAMEVDAQTGSITFSSDVLFRFNSYTLTKDSQAILKEIIPMYLEVLLQDRYRPYIAEIIVEGHTDTISDYQSNMLLSFNRANSVARFFLNPSNGLSDEKIEQLQALLTVNGRSFSNPIYKAGTNEVDMEASRRVEIKFRLKEDEMINRISQILNQQ